MARPERFELPTTWFVARYSIQLSYGRSSKAHIILMSTLCVKISDDFFLQRSVRLLQSTIRSSSLMPTLARVLASTFLTMMAA